MLPTWCSTWTASRTRSTSSPRPLPTARRSGEGAACVEELGVPVLEVLAQLGWLLDGRRVDGERAQRMARRSEKRRGASQYGETWLASAARATRRGATMSDELDEYEDGVERDEAAAAEIDEELALSDADQISDGSAEQDETSFDETRLEYSGAEEGDVDVEEMEEAGPLLDDPEKTALLERAIDDPDGRDGWA
jgi:hypothetical protein